MRKITKDGINWAAVCFKSILTRNTGTGCVSVTKYILAMVPKASLGLLKRQACVRYCQDCIEQAHEPTEKDKKHYHCWAAAGHSSKSDIYFHEVPGNTNGKMSQQVYIDKSP